MILGEVNGTEVKALGSSTPCGASPSALDGAMRSSCPTSASSTSACSVGTSRRVRQNSAWLGLALGMG